MIYENKAPKTAKNTRGNDVGISESAIQSACVVWFKNEFRPIRDRLYMVHNDGKKNLIQAAQDKARGLTKGVLDLNLDIPNEQYHGLRIELKKPGERTTPEQKKMIEQNLAFGYKSVVVDSLEQFQAAVLDYLPEPLKERKNFY